MFTGCDPVDSFQCRNGLCIPTSYCDDLIMMFLCLQAVTPQIVFSVVTVSVYPPPSCDDLIMMFLCLQAVTPQIVFSVVTVSVYLPAFSVMVMITAVTTRMNPKTIMSAERYRDVSSPLLNYFCKIHGYFQFESIINVLVSSFRLSWIPMLWVYGH